jgi:hypothetical protein
VGPAHAGTATEERSRVQAALLEDLTRQRQELYELCASLIRIPSENPPGDTTKLVAFIGDYLSVRGLKTRIHEPKAGMPNPARHAGQRPPQSRALGAISTNSPPADGWTFPPFAGTLANGKIMGRGAGDMKAGLAVALFVVTLLKERDVELDGRVTLAFASDEETGGRWGTEWLLANVPEVRGDALPHRRVVGDVVDRHRREGRALAASGRRRRVGPLGLWPGHERHRQDAARGEDDPIARRRQGAHALRTSRTSCAAAAIVEKRWGRGTGRMADHLTMTSARCAAAAR